MILKRSNYFCPILSPSRHISHYYFDYVAHLADELETVPGLLGNVTKVDSVRTSAM